MRVPWRREFDPAREFVIRKPLTVGGRKFAAGETFDPALVTVRRLRQLFDQHVLVFAGDTPGKVIRDYRRHPREVLERQKLLRSTGGDLPGPEGAPLGDPPPHEPHRHLPPRERRERVPGRATSEAAPQEPQAGEASPEALEAQEGAKERARRSAIEIPQDWERQPWNTVRGLAKEIEPDAAIKDKETALRVIAEEIAHRAGTS